jgi:hypothetical protein
VVDLGMILVEARERWLYRRIPLACPARPRGRPSEGMLGPFCTGQRSIKVHEVREGCARIEVAAGGRVPIAQPVIATAGPLAMVRNISAPNLALAHGLLAGEAGRHQCTATQRDQSLRYRGHGV